MKKYMAILVSVALLLVALVAISGCAPKAQTSSQPTVQAPAPTTQAPAPTVQAPAPTTQAPAVASQSTTTTTTQTTTSTTNPSAKQPTASANKFDAYIQGLPAILVAAKVGGVTCTYQFDVTGSADPGMYWVKIANGTCTVGNGTVSNPTLTITTPEQLWFDIVSKKVNGTSAFLANQFTATPMSNISYLQNMAGYFGQ